MTKSIRFALPKGRLAKDIMPLLEQVGVAPEASFEDETERRLVYRSSRDDVALLQAKPFDVATLVAVGGAHMGICGADVLYEYAYSEVYAPVDLKQGACRLSIAGLPAQLAKPLHAYAVPIRIATKYPLATRRHFAAQGLEVEIIKLNGSVELAPILGVADRIVDLVSTGATLKANGLVEESIIFHSTARLIINRTASKVMARLIRELVTAFESVATR